MIEIILFGTALFTWLCWLMRYLRKENQHLKNYTTVIRYVYRPGYEKEAAELFLKFISEITKK